MENKYTKEEINTFLMGHHPQEGIISVECGYNDIDVSIVYRNKDSYKRYLQKDNFYPFLWCKQKVLDELYEGRQSALQYQMNKFGIAMKSLKITDDEGNTNPKVQNGYRYMFYATKPMTNSTFQSFFRFGKVKTFGNKDIVSFSPVEQYLISTGKRLFKGYEDYDDILRLQFDIETTGLDPKRHEIDQIGISTNRGYNKIIGIKGEPNSEEKKTNEIAAIEQFIAEVAGQKPDVIAGHNVFNFDWNFFFTRYELLTGNSLTDFSKKFYTNPLKVSEKESILKLGGEMEKYRPITLWGHNMIDGIHAVRRAMAIDSNIKSAGLKYITKYAKHNKPNRVYVEGNEIGTVYADETETYALDDTNGDWYKINKEKPLKDGYVIVTGKYIVERYLADDLYESDKVELTYNQSNFLLSKMIPTTFSKACTMGTAGIWKLILAAWSYERGLAIPELAEKKTFTGGLSRLLKVGFVDRVVKLDYNSLYPAIMLTFGIAPSTDTSGIMLTFLEHILSERERFKGLMKVAGKNAAKCENELKSGIYVNLNTLKLDIQRYKAEVNSYNNKQLPFKIFGNSFFGSFGAPYIFYWGETAAAEEVTCTGRQALRLMIKWFSERNFIPIVGDTDGFNFQYPENADEYHYIGKGLNRNTKDGVEYQGVEAYVAEFNDLFMRNKMGLGIDEYAVATINFARKNYADLLLNEKTGATYVKLVGNSIKSKKMPIYIENFLNEGIMLLLTNKGHQFIDNYYDYIDKIYNLNIPLLEIANKGKVKMTIPEYVERCKGVNKAGNPVARQAHMELIIKTGTKVDVGDTVYYVNNGKTKSASDIKNEKEKGIKFNCEMIPMDLINDPDLDEKMNLEYNVAKYIDAFNKRITPLLVCFNPDIRSQILAKTPKDRKYFTVEECELVSGFPIKEEHQDDYHENLMKMEDKEIKFWIERNKKPHYNDELEVNWEETVEDYYKRIEEYERLGIINEVNEFNKIIDELKQSEAESFMNDGIIPKKINTFSTLDVKTKQFISNTFNKPIGNIYDMIDMLSIKEFEEE